MFDCCFVVLDNFIDEFNWGLSVGNDDILFSDLCMFDVV